MTFSDLQSKHRTEFSELLVSYFQELGADIPEDIIKGKLLDLIENQTLSGIIHTTLAFQEAKMIGFSVYQIDSQESDWCKRPGWGFIREFYIRPDYRRKACGRQLAALTEAALRELDAEQLYLTSDENKDFWLSCGWTETQELCSNGLPVLEK